MSDGMDKTIDHVSRFDGETPFTSKRTATDYLLDMVGIGNRGGGRSGHEHDGIGRADHGGCFVLGEDPRKSWNPVLFLFENLHE